MSDEAALLSAIIAHADEDTPRLAYADWLDEHGDSDRAEFIRTQCRLADLSPAHPDWIDLTERQLELVARLKDRFLFTDLNEFDNADRFSFDTDILGDHEAPYCRGFPYFIACQTDGDEWHEENEVTRVAGELERLVRTSTLRAFEPYSTPPRRLIELLSFPVIGELTGLALMPEGSSAEVARLYRHLCRTPLVRRVKHLFLYRGTPADAVAELARAKTFDSVTRLTIQSLSAPQPALEKLTRAPWFRRVRHFRCFLDKPAVATSLLAGLGQLPDLHTLDLPEVPPGGARLLAAGRFPALARLMYAGPLGVGYAKQLAAGRFPALSAFQATHGAVKNDGMAELLNGAWFERLRVLALTECHIGDRAVAALAAHPVATTLRVLRLGDNTFGKTGLTALAGAFPALTTLSLRSYSRRKGSPAELAAFLAALRMPHLRHLDLMGWPLGNAGAKALATNPTFAGLTRLCLDDCKIGDPGAKALLDSPHLQNLVELHLSYNAIRNSADALADPAVLPRLGECWLGSNKITRKTAEKLKRDGLYLIT
jgi:uncharacterized protein (TIGR02996 family)